MIQQNASFSIYNASAGSGKTFTLSKEYIKILLLSPSKDAYKKILAITFTNKAVEEMKHRILFYLLEFSKENTSQKAIELLEPLSQETGLSRVTIKEKSTKIIKNIIHNYTAFDISTIDKFTLKIIKSFSHELNIPVDFDISIDTDSLMQEAVDAVISKAGEDEELTQLLLEYSKNNTFDDKNWDVSYELLAASKQLTNENYKLELKDIETKTIAEFVETKKTVQNQLKNLKQQTASLAAAILNLINNNGIAIESFSYKSFPNHLTKIVNGTVVAADLFKFTDLDSVKIKKDSLDKDTIISILPEALSNLQIVYNFLQEQILLEAFNKNIYPISLLNSINLAFKKIQSDQNILSISQFNQIIYNEIQNQPVPFIYEKMGSKYRHFFIDEFQDTSILQWKNLFPLIDNALSSEENDAKSSLLLVGDPKQAIYRWRGGKAEQFISLTKNESPFSNKDKQTINLETNFRSYSQVIEFNNTFFKFLSGKFQNPDYVDLYKNCFQNSTKKTGGYACISFIDSYEIIDESKEEEDENDKNTMYLNKTVQTITNILAQGFNYKDMALLVRTKAHGVLLANYLTENKIPILSSETLLIQNATEVKLILNVLKYINNKTDTDAKVHLLYYVARHVHGSSSVHDLIAQNLNATEQELEQSLEKNGVSIRFNACRKKSLYEVVELIVSAFIKEKANNSYVQYFLDLVLERHVKAQSTLADFIDYWSRIGYKKSIPSPDGNNAIKIMTIHKSKGLEFPVVIYPFANIDFSRKNREQMWIPINNDKINFTKALVDCKNDVLLYGDEAQKLYQTKNEEEVLDNINVLYVALTRAVEQLYVISDMRFKKNGELPNMLSSYFIEFLQLHKNFDKNVFQYEFGEAKRVSQTNELTTSLDEIKVVQHKINASAIKIAQKEALMWGSAQSEAIEFGNTLHEIMSYIKTKDDISLALQLAFENGLIATSQKSTIEAVVSAIVFNTTLNMHFSSEATIYNETRILDTNKKTYIPDRVAIINNKAYLLDYKTGSEQEKHKIQLLQYELLLQKMGFIVAEKILVYLGESLKIIPL